MPVGPEPGRVSDGGGPDEHPPRLFAVLVTHRRPGPLAHHLTVLAEQRRSPDYLVVVDNAPDTGSEAVVAEHAPAFDHVDYLPMPENLGPAGGFGRGLQHVLDGARDHDWVVMLDDGNPPRIEWLLERLVALAAEQRAADPDVAMVGVTGSRFDHRRGRMIRFPDADLCRGLDVDYIASGQFPILSVGAVRQVGVYDERLFFSFEDLDLCLRLRAAGFRLRIDGELALWARERFGRTGSSFDPARGEAAPPWRRYYSIRNLVHILRSNGDWPAAVVVTVTAGIVRPVQLASRRRDQATRYLTLSARAIVDGWAGRLGRRVEPDTDLSKTAAMLAAPETVDTTAAG